MMNFIQSAWKAVAAGLLAGGGVLIKAYSDGGGLSQNDWASAIGIAIVAAVTIYRVKNKA